MSVRVAGGLTAAGRRLLVIVSRVSVIGFWRLNRRVLEDVSFRTAMASIETAIDITGVRGVVTQGVKRGGRP